MKNVLATVRKYNGIKLGNIMIRLFRENNTHFAASEAEVSGFYKDIMANREYSGVYQ